MKKNLQELSDQELLKEAKNARFVLGIFIGVIIVMVISGAISTIKQGINVFTFLPVVFLGIAVAFSSHYTKVKNELKSRKHRVKKTKNCLNCNNPITDNFF